MARVTQEQVAQIVSINSGDDLTPFITTASLLVDDVLASTDMSATRLTNIELWLSAHYYCIFNPRTSKESVKSVEESFQYRVDLNFNVTTYGQQALVLDTTGTLADLQEQAEAGTSDGNGSYFVQSLTSGVPRGDM